MNNVAVFHCGGRFPGGTALAASFAALSPGSSARAVSPRSRPLHFNQQKYIENQIYNLKFVTFNCKLLPLIQYINSLSVGEPTDTISSALKLFGFREF